MSIMVGCLKTKISGKETTLSNYIKSHQFTQCLIQQFCYKKYYYSTRLGGCFNNLCVYIMNNYLLQFSNYSLKKPSKVHKTIYKSTINCTQIITHYSNYIFKINGSLNEFQNYLLKIQFSEILIIFVLASSGEVCFPQIL